MESFSSSPADQHEDGAVILRRIPLSPISREPYHANISTWFTTNDTARCVPPLAVQTSCGSELWKQRKRVLIHARHGWEDPAKEAYQRAVAIFRSELTEDECKRIWLDDKTSLQDVQCAIMRAQAEYEKRSKKSKARIWLARCSSRIIYYGNVMDVLVQQSPEYVSLVWGAMKFLFMACTTSLDVYAKADK